MPARLIALATAGLCLLAAVACSPRTPDPESPRHLVLLTLDTLRADRLGAYGYTKPTSPHLDRLAAAGVRFDDALTVAVSTAASHASILTGLEPPSHGLRRNWGEALSPENRTLAEILHDAGFVTAAFVSAPPLRKEVGLDQGFDLYDAPPRLDSERARRIRRPAEVTTQRAIEWLAERDEGRLFLWVHYFDPHFPYLRALRDRPDASGARGVNAAINANDPEQLAPPLATVRLMSDLYDDEIRYMDAQIGRLLSALADHGVLEDAVVAVLADHGEHLGEHGYFFGHYDVLEETAQVPMILVRPRAAWAGRVVESPVATIDVMPTVLGWLGVGAGTPLGGRDLDALIQGAAPTDRRIYTEQLEYFPVRAIRSGERLLLTRGDSDFPTAPLGSGLYVRRGAARHALTPSDEIEIRASLEEDLRRIAGAERQVAPVAIDVPADVGEQLRALGYVEGAEP